MLHYALFGACVINQGPLTGSSTWKKVQSAFPSIVRIRIFASRLALILGTPFQVYIVKTLHLSVTISEVHVAAPEAHVGVLILLSPSSISSTSVALASKDCGFSA